MDSPPRTTAHQVTVRWLASTALAWQSLGRREHVAVDQYGLPDGRCSVPVRTPMLRLLHQLASDRDTRPGHLRRPRAHPASSRRCRSNSNSSTAALAAVPARCGGVWEPAVGHNLGRCHRHPACGAALWACASMVNVQSGQRPSSRGSCASSGRAWRLWAARYSQRRSTELVQGEARPLDTHHCPG